MSWSKVRNQITYKRGGGCSVKEMLERSVDGVDLLLDLLSLVYKARRARLLLSLSGLVHGTNILAWRGF